MATKEMEKPDHIPASERNAYQDLKRAGSDPQAEAEQKRLRAQALEELSEKGVFRGNPEDIQRKMSEIRAREAGQN